MKLSRKIFYFSVFLFFTAFILSAENNTVIGVVVAVKGNFKHHYTVNGQQLTEQLKPGEIIYRDSTVTPVSGRGSFFQIGTQTDLVKIGSFPDSSFTSSSPALSDEKYDLFTSMTAGHTISRYSSGTYTTDGDIIDLGSIDEEYMKRLAVVLSPTENSMTNGSINPFYVELSGDDSNQFGFKILKDKEISSISYLLDFRTSVVAQAGPPKSNFIQKGSEWWLSFEKFLPLQEFKEYEITVTIHYTDGKSEKHFFWFQFAGKEVKNILRMKAMQDVTEMENNELFTHLAIAARYLEFGLKLEAWEILAEQGVDFRNMIKP